MMVLGNPLSTGWTPTNSKSIIFPFEFSALQRPVSVCYFCYENSRICQASLFWAENFNLICLISRPTPDLSKYENIYICPLKSFQQTAFSIHEQDRRWRKKLFSLRESPFSDIKASITVFSPVWYLVKYLLYLCCYLMNVYNIVQS